MKKLFEKVRSKKKGFTLVELIVVIGIIAILAAVLVPTLTHYIGNARNSKLHTNAKVIYDAANAAAAEAITNGYSLNAGTIGLGDDIETDSSASIKPSDYIGSAHIAGTADIVVTADGVTSVTYTEGTESATYTP